MTGCRKPILGIHSHPPAELANQHVFWCKLTEIVQLCNRRFVHPHLADRPVQQELRRVVIAVVGQEAHLWLPGFDQRGGGDCVIHDTRHLRRVVLRRRRNAHCQSRTGRSDHGHQ